MKSYIEIEWKSVQDTHEGKLIGLPSLQVTITLGLLDEQGQPLKNAEGGLKRARGEYMLYAHDLRDGFSIWNFIEEAVAHHNELIPQFIKLELKEKSGRLQ